MMYKGIKVSGNSSLGEAIKNNKPKEAQKIYKATGLAFQSLYGKEDASWFYEKAKEVET